MMRERELAELLIRTATDKGIDVERAAEEVAAMPMPSFVDVDSFRSAVVDAVESQLRAQMEQRLQLLRRRFDMDRRTPAEQAEFGRSTAPSAADQAPAQTDPAASTEATQPGGADVAAADATEEEEMPSDATMVWTTRHG